MNASSRHILVADDDPSALLLMEAALVSAGFTVTLAADGNEALARMASGSFDLIMLDIDMPGRSGLQVCAELRKMVGELLPIVMVTGMDDVESVDSAYCAGATDFIAKPISWALIAHRIRYILRGYQITRDLQSAREKVYNLAYYDGLTGAPNREHFRSLLANAIAPPSGEPGRFALLCIDLDNFKRINDTLGHGVGDSLLRVVASRLCSELRRCLGRDPAEDRTGRHDGVCRVGGDEFMLLLHGVESADDALAVADRLIGAVSQPMRLGQHEVLVTPSVGVAMFPADARDAEALVCHADLAMYFAKRRAPGTAATFQSNMSAGALLRLTLEAELRNAIARNELSLEYQPQYSLDTGRVACLEALLRWQHPSLGAVPATEFIPVAEQTGLILPIGEWVLRTACQQAYSWWRENLPPIRVAVNVSGAQLTQANFTETVTAVLRETGLPPHLLELEITETIIVQDDARAIRSIRELQALGVEIAIDDFGAGHSGFARLSGFPVNRVKIDRTFVERASMSSGDNAIVAAMISMAKALKAEVVAEGVEEVEQLMLLQERGCDLGQGFLLSRPLHVRDAAALLRRAAEDTRDTPVWGTGRQQSA